jgi:DNA polymerase I-like protein with 3'-5' exonuclease and polymerase domains
MFELMKRHVEAVRGDCFSALYNFERPSKPVVALDVETPSIGGPLWSWECGITAWSVSTRSRRVYNEVRSGLESCGVVPLTPELYTPGLFTVGAKYTKDPIHRLVLREILDGYTCVFHNSSFDLQRLEVLGLIAPRPGDYQDTMLMAYAVGHLPGNLSLGKLAPLIGRTKVGASKEDFDNVTEEVLRRNLSDTEITLLLYEYLEPLLREDPNVEAHYRYIDLPFSRIVREMQATGLFLDTEKLREFSRETRTEEARLLRVLRNMVPPYPEKGTGTTFPEDATGVTFAPRPNGGLNLSEVTPNTQYRFTTYDETRLTKKGLPWKKSNLVWFDYVVETEFEPSKSSHLLWAFEQLGIGLPEVATGSGEPCLDAETLRSLPYHPFLEALAAWRKQAKLTSTYLGPYEELTEGQSGVCRIRGSYRQCGTYTGRLSSASPNLQNVPARGKLGQRLRGLFVAPPGETLIIGDDSQIEARILADNLALYFEDFRSLDAFKRGVDIHLDNAVNWGIVHAVRPLDADQICEKYHRGDLDKDSPEAKAPREAEKTALYAVIYGAGPLKVGNGDISLGRSIMAAMDEACPAIGKYKALLLRAARKRRGIIYNAFGRRMRYADVCASDGALRSRAERQIGNYAIQSTSFSRMASRAIVASPRVWRQGGKFSAMVHDEFHFHVKTAGTLPEELTAVFSDPGSLRLCPVEMKFSVVESWGAKG